jgi:polysaccharide pyruvyl transferase WcaK-like protein
MKSADGHWFDLTPEAMRMIATILAPKTDPLDFWALLARGGRFFSSAPDWITAMMGRDLVLGTRLHGTMAALAAGTPAAIITHDSRTSELATTMHLPRLTMPQVMASPTVDAALGQISFDGLAFDQWRRIAAAQMVDACTKIGMPLAAPLKALAQGGVV